MILRTYPLRDAPGVRRAAALGPHFERHLVMLQLQVPVHAGHLQRRRARHAAELPPFPTRPRNQELIAIYIYIYIYITNSAKLASSCSAVIHYIL